MHYLYRYLNLLVNQMCPTNPINKSNKFLKNRNKIAVLVVEVKCELR